MESWATDIVYPRNDFGVSSHGFVYRPTGTGPPFCQHSPGSQESGALLMKSGTCFTEIDLSTGLHSEAVMISLENALTVSSVYLLPNTPVSKNSLAEHLGQIRKRLFIRGDFKAHSPAWGDSHPDGRAGMLEDFISENSIIDLKRRTFVHLTYHSTSAIYLAVAFLSPVAKWSWVIHTDLCGRDHFTICLPCMSSFNGEANNILFNIRKADLGRFGYFYKLSLDDRLLSFPKQLL
ncbi:Pol-like protein [Plakobranchus ocellatus]|uniref:Pol-like protein n=1 Tax=Plakobranchus ocellatus TaxID=259542 RepID=A0AAV4CZR5_9GAST|nr:Pol-like protein [Plakobranchus ocellatus]